MIQTSPGHPRVHRSAAVQALLRAEDGVRPELEGALAYRLTAKRLLKRQYELACAAIAFVQVRPRCPPVCLRRWQASVRFPLTTVEDTPSPPASSRGAVPEA